MKKYFLPFLVLLFLNVNTTTQAQTDPDEMGAWYMYIFSTQFKKDSLWGIQGDIQHRNFNILGDLQQLLLRGGITYMPKESPLKLTLGYAYISTGTQGDSDESIAEKSILSRNLFPCQIRQTYFFTSPFTIRNAICGKSRF